MSEITRAEINDAVSDTREFLRNRGIVPFREWFDCFLACHALLLASEEREKRIKEAVDNARCYLCATPSNKPKCNILLLRIVQGAFDNPSPPKEQSNG